MALVKLFGFSHTPLTWVCVSESKCIERVRMIREKKYEGWRVHNHKNKEDEFGLLDEAHPQLTAEVLCFLIASVILALFYRYNIVYFRPPLDKALSLTHMGIMVNWMREIATQIQRI